MRGVEPSAHVELKRGPIPDSAGDAAGWLRAGRIADHPALRLGPEAGWGHTELGADIARQLKHAVPLGWEVSTDVLWTPTSQSDLALHADVVVHRPLEPDGGWTVPPMLCVTIAPGARDLRSSRGCACFGVDHFWHLDSANGSLEVLVRVDDEYRHAETLTAARHSPGAEAQIETLEWVDFGVGVLQLTIGAGAAYRFVSSSAAAHHQLPPRPTRMRSPSTECVNLV